MKTRLLTIVVAAALATGVLLVVNVPSAAQVGPIASGAFPLPVPIPASAVNGAGVIKTPQVLGPLGTAAAPTWSYVGDTGTGFYRTFANMIGVSNNGVEAFIFSPAANGGLRTGSGVGIGWSSSADPFGSANDTILMRAAAGALNLSGAVATNTAEFQVAGGNGGFISSVKALTELTTIAAAATTATAIQIPANCVVLGVSVRVVTVIPTAATFTVTSATPTKTWNTAAVAVAATTTDPGTLGAPSFQTTASSIVITPNLTPGAATGQVRVTIYYYAITPATS